METMIPGRAAPETRALRMLAIEENLGGERKEDYRKAYDRILIGIQRKCRAAQDAGLDGGDLESCRMLEEAAVLGRKILRLSADWL